MALQFRYCSPPLHLISHHHKSGTLLSEQPSAFSAAVPRHAAGRTAKFLQPLSAVTRDNDSLSSMITELERERGQEKAAQSPKADDKLAERWREIHGKNEWKGLLDPMDPLMRSELIRYGEFAQACYDAFDYDEYSRYCGSCKYGRRTFFESLGMGDAGYDVTRYLYATSDLDMPKFVRKSKLGSKIWSKRANWIGYIAVSDDETTARIGRRDVVVAWRGTVTKLEWVADLKDYLQRVDKHGIPCPDPAAKVEAGFVDLYVEKDETCRFCKYSAREQVLTEVRKLVEKYTAAGEEMSISVMGHSLGSALAMLSAYDLAETGVVNLAGEGSGRKVPVAVFSFAGPRVGNGHWKERFEGLGIKALRVVNVHDTVPKVPGVVVNEGVPSVMRKLAGNLPWAYSHVGVEMALDHRHSPFLKDTFDPADFHNLEMHLHILDGYHGKGKKFELGGGRDPALVNKSCDFLKDELMVPPSWRQDANKGMIRTLNGRWAQPERPKIEDHHDDVDHHLRQLGLAGDDN